MKKLYRTLLILAITAAVMCNTHIAAVSASGDETGYYSEEEIRGFAEGIVEWKKDSAGAKSVEELISDNLVEYAGDQSADWYILGMARIGMELDYSPYISALSIRIMDIYDSDKSSSLSVTEFHRMALTMLAAGGDPSNIIPDSTYNRDRDIPLDKQGIPGLIWALITLDSMHYGIPEESTYTREDIIEKILMNELEGGGFALSGSAPDPDITAMAIQALAPYYNRTEPGLYVRDAIDRAIEKLSGLQENEGDYSSWGNKNAQTGAQVMVALCCLGIDPQKDPRFIKNGNTLMDGLLRYRMEDGGFANTYPAERSNSKTSEQVLYTFAAVLRQMSGTRYLYDMRPEMEDEIKLKIDSLARDIEGMDTAPSEQEVLVLEERYLEIPEDERMYVYNYYKLEEISPVQEESSSSENQQEPEQGNATVLIALAAGLIFISGISILALAVNKRRKKN